MRRVCMQFALLSALLTLTAISVAWAHVRVSPEEVPGGGFEKLTVTVPTERDVPTTKVRVEVPEGFTVLGVRPVPDWDYEFEEEAGEITAVRWSGGESGPREFQEFTLQTRTPEEAGEYAWNAYQTYEGGEVVEWTGPEDSEEPASVVRVAAGDAESDSQGAATQESSSEDLPRTATAPVVAYGGLGVGALALIVALVALLRRGKR